MTSVCSSIDFQVSTHFCSLSLLTKKQLGMAQCFEGTVLLFFFLVPIWHVLVNGFSEQNLVIQPIHPYSPAPCCLPTRTSAPAMQPMPRMQTTIPMKCTALYRTSKKNQESSITTGMTKQSRSCQERKEKSTNHLLTL